MTGSGSGFLAGWWRALVAPRATRTTCKPPGIPVSEPAESLTARADLWLAREYPPDHPAPGDLGSIPL